MQGRRVCAADALIAEGVHQHLVAQSLAHLGDSLGHDNKADLEYVLVVVDSPLHRSEAVVVCKSLGTCKNIGLGMLVDHGDLIARA